LSWDGKGKERTLLLCFARPSVEISNNKLAKGLFVVNDFLKLVVGRIDLYSVRCRGRRVAVNDRDCLMRIDEMDDRWMHDETNAGDASQWHLPTTNDDDSIIHSSHAGPPALDFLQRNHMILNVTGSNEEPIESGIGRDCSRVACIK
uniref:Recep_L_domain domain-containing protein n=1 Tax=Haemonchus placei TaxID=6290 RepID=A0A0N4VS38_HAEPC